MLPILRYKWLFNTILLTAIIIIKRWPTPFRIAFTAASENVIFQNRNFFCHYQLFDLKVKQEQGNTGSSGFTFESNAFALRNHATACDKDSSSHTHARSLYRAARENRLSANDGVIYLLKGAATERPAKRAGQQRWPNQRAASQRSSINRNVLAAFKEPTGSVGSRWEPLSFQDKRSGSAQRRATLQGEWSDLMHFIMPVKLYARQLWPALILSRNVVLYVTDGYVTSLNSHGIPHEMFLITFWLAMWKSYQIPANVIFFRMLLPSLLIRVYPKI